MFSSQTTPDSRRILTLAAQLDQKALTLDGVGVAEVGVGAGGGANEAVKGWALLGGSAGLVGVALSALLDEKFLSLSL